MTENQAKIKKVREITSFWEVALTYFLIFSGITLVLFFAHWWFSWEHVPSNFHGIYHLFDFILFGLVSFVVWYQIMNEVLTWDLALSMKRALHIEPAPGLKVAMLTAFVPSKEPIEMLEKTLRAMVAVRYPHHTWVLDEGDDDKVKALCRKLGVKHFSRKGIEKYNMPSGPYKARTKGGNYNGWFHKFGSNYDIVAQHDMDFVPVPEYLEKTLGYFRDPQVAFVGTPQIYGNTGESWIVQGAAEQAYGFYGTVQRGLCGKDMHLLIGANHVIRVAAHDDIDGYAGHIVEDHLTGMRLYGNKWKSVYIPEALLVGEGPATWDSYFSQQMRWAYGLMDILFRHSPSILPKMKFKHTIRYFILQQYYFFGLIQAVGIGLISLFFFTGIPSASMDLTTVLIYYPSFLLFQIIIFLWLQRYYIDPKKESGFHIRGKVLSIAAWPIYLLAFISAAINKPLSYQVTPKGTSGGSNNSIGKHLSNFLLHFILGTLTLVGLLVAYEHSRMVPQLAFWAIINTLFMYFFVALAFAGWYRENKISKKPRKTRPSYSFADKMTERLVFNYKIIPLKVRWSR